MINFNANPYFDDYNEDDNFYRILFRPSFAVQARELTQLQTILQQQIKRHGDHIFKEGAMVIPGEMSIDNTIGYVKLETTFQGNNIEPFLKNLVGRVATGEAGVTALVIAVASAADNNPPSIYVKYTSSGTNGETKVFGSNEVINIGTNTVQTVSTDPVGLGTIATIKRGVYYVKGFFTLVEEQTIVVDRYSAAASKRIGLNVDERTVAPEDEGYDNLLDNAQGSYNFAAPGAHRYYIDLVLSTREIGSENDENFVELAQVVSGEIRRHVNKTEYSELEKTFARRTYDESGNYVVRNFTIDVREHRSNNRGEWTSNTSFLIGDVVVSNGSTYVAKNSSTSINIAPSHSAGNAFDGPGSTGVQWEYNENPFYNRGVYSPAEGGDEAKLAIGLEPGKAYVEGYEIEKISTEYVDVDKSREFVQVDNAVIPATIGNYLLVNNTNNLPPVHTFSTVQLYDRLTGSSGRGTGVGSVVGTARVRFYEWHSGTIGQTTAVYKLGLFDVKMIDNKSFDRNVKSVYFNVSNDPQLSYSSDIESRYVRLIGSATASASTSVVGTGTSFQTDLIVGDFVRIGTEVRRVTAIGSQTALTVDVAVTVTGATIDLLTAAIREPEYNSLLFPFPYYAIKSVRSEIGTNDNTYAVYERFTGTSSTLVGGTCSLTVSTTSGTFASAADLDNYIVVNNSPTAGGSVVVPISINVVGTSVTFTLDGSFASTAFVVIGAVNKAGATLTEKTKTLISTNISLTTQATATRTELLLGKADIYRIVSIKMDTGSFASPSGVYGIDITDRYNVDTGQRPTHYDIGRLSLKASFVPPTAPIQIVFEHFTHSAGDYFTVNSYPSNVSYAAIPIFDGLQLRDYIDFRPRISDSGLDFTSAGSSMSLVPKRGIDVRSDFQYFLARKTKIVVDFDGNFFAINGVSAINPGEPLELSMGMILYDLALEPYTFSTSSRSVVVGARDNKRYTMRDIGKLEKRIDNLEYYTSLSLLEQQTESLDVIDTSGESRFKNGFIVDSFTGHTTGDTNSPDYLCSIDMENGELRPFYSMQNVNLIEKNTSNTQRVNGNYQLYGDVITLPVVDHIPLVRQDFASRIENINPFAIFTFLGNVELTPATDDWFEVNRRPDLVVEVEGNFNTIKSIAEKAGVLGTVWNSWQTQWSGAPIATGETKFTAGTNWASGFGDVRISVDEMRQRFGTGDNATIDYARQVTVQTQATEIGQQRNGVRSSLVTKIDRQIVADRVLSTAAIPYIRSRNILVQVRGLKPNTRFFPFFDNVDVASYCTPSSRLVYTPVSGTFDDSTNVGGLSSETARRIQNDSQVCLNRGDVIVGQVSGATAVVVSREFSPDTGVFALYIINLNGTFTVNETFIGSVSAARGTFTSVSNQVQGNNLVTNFSGDVSLLFNIPNTDSIRFRTGIREFKLVDTNQAEGEFTSRGRQLYRAQGVLETRQSTVNAVRNAELVEEQLSQNRVVVQTSERVVADTGWYDPLAQTFLVEQQGGAFLTKVDVFFATKDRTIPVNLEIREVVNGYPGKLVLPFSKVSLKPEQVKLSTNTVLVDGVQTPKYDTPSTFVFPSPVYVQHNSEYAIVLSSDSNNYKVWISQVGDQIPGSSRTISEQPYQGVFFKSQNASTWTADQMQDLKFTIYRAQFATNVIGNVEFVNDSLTNQRLDFDPLEMVTGITKVRVYQRDHGMPVGSRVLITDLDQTKLTGTTATGTITTTTSSTTVTGVGTTFTSQVRVGTGLYTNAGQYIGQVSSIASNTSLTLTANAIVAVSGQVFKFVNPIGGVPANQIYAQHVISDIALDSYCITVANAPTANGYFGGTTMRATRNMQYDEVQPLVQVQTFPETMTTFGIKTTSGRSVDGTQTPYIADTVFQPVLANENNKFFSPRLVGSDINEATSLGGNKSVTFNVTMKTDRDSLSPILDTQRTSLIVINNKVDSPTEENTNVGGLDDFPLLTSTAIAFTANAITSTDTAARGILQTVAIGKFITVSGSSGGTNDGTYLVTGVSDDGITTTVTVNSTLTVQAAGSSVTLTAREFFVDEIAPVGSTTYSKYVTRRVNLATPSTFIRVKFAASIPADAMVEVYYKTAPVGSTAPFEEVSYVKLDSDQPITFVQNGSNTFVDVNYSATGLSEFDAIQVKLVMKSINSAAVPKIKDLRIIACS
jgi:hypothetical protein